MLPDGPLWVILIRVIILLLRLITPLCVIYTALFFTGLAPNTHVRNVRVPLEIITIPETFFYLLIYLPRSHFLQKPAPEGNRLSHNARRELFTNCLNNVLDIEYFMRTWFRGAPTKEIKKGDLQLWLAWGLWNHYSINRLDLDELDGYVAEVEKKLGRKLEEGVGGHQPVRISIDKVNIQHRPLIWYMIVGVVDTFSFLKMWYLGFQHFPMYEMFKSFPWRLLSCFCRQFSPARDISYWYRPHTSKKHPPILYIHGIGIGLFTYTNFFADILHKNQKSDPNNQIGVIAIEIMPISFRITAQTLQREEMVRQITQILRHHGWIDDEHNRQQKFVLAGNSYGTIVANYLLHHSKLLPNIGPVILIDPIAVWVHMGDIAYNFTAKPPKSASERELHYFACTDMGAAHAVTRRFVWTENVLWKHEMVGRKFAFVLSGKDIILDAGRCRKHLLHGQAEIERSSIGQVTGAEVIKADNLEILWFKNLNHAEVFEKKKERKVLVDLIWRYCRGT